MPLVQVTPGTASVEIDGSAAAVADWNRWCVAYEVSCGPC